MNNQNSRERLEKGVLCAAFACCVLTALVTASAATPKVTTVAGGYVGNGKPATSASFANPSFVARDANGNLYISDSNNCQIRKINAKRTITSMAGTGICGYSGDGGAARSAMINSPQGLAFDGKGNLLFADAVNARIRKITPSGTITTIAGDGTVGYSGDGHSATLATLASPNGVSVDPSGNIYIADLANNVIRMVDTVGIIHTVAGNNTYGSSGDGGPAISAQLAFPSNVLADNSGNFYIADANNLRVRRVDTDGTITTYAGNGLGGNEGNDGPATSAGIGVPHGLLLSGTSLYIGTSGNVWVVDLATQLINLVAGTAYGEPGFNGDGNPALSTTFSGPCGLAFDGSENLLIADAGNVRIRRIEVSQIVTTIAGGFIGDGGRATAASLTAGLFGGHIAFDPTGNLYIADTLNNRIRKVSPSGVITTFAGTGISGYSGDRGPATAANLFLPFGVAVDGTGNVYIADTDNLAIRKVDSTGTITTFFSNVEPFGLAVDQGGNVYAADATRSVIWKITPAGSATIVAGVSYFNGYNGDGILANQAWLYFPTGVTVDNTGNLYIADRYNNRVRKVDISGMISTVAGNGFPGYSGDGGPATAAMIDDPADVAFDAKGNLYVADSLNRVRVVGPSGTINTLAGTGQYGYNGNGLPAKEANVSPVALAADSKNILYVNDEASDRVRKIH